MFELNKIYNIDYMEGIKQIQDNSIDMILTDPPFGVNHDNAEWDKNINFKDLMIKLDKEFIRILKPGCYYFSWIPKGELLKIGTYIDDIKLFAEINPFTVFNKKMHWMSGITPIIAKIKGNVRQDIKGGHDFYITDSANTSLKNKNNPRNIKHPASKGVKTCKYIIDSYSQKNDIILDCFSGSGSIPLGAILTNRNFIGFEINKEYCDLANKRLKNIPKRLF